MKPLGSLPSQSGDVPRSAGSLQYTPALDGLRAVAVLGVLVAHYGLGEQLRFVEKLLPWGHLGVQLFFVLSGFLITSILLKSRADLPDSSGLWGTLKVFYVRRALRIFPAYYAVILVFVLTGSEGFMTVLPYHLLYLSNTVSATYSESGLIHPASAHFWSLSVEEQFYLVWPLVVLATPRRWLPAVGMGLVVLAPLCRLCLFLIGYPHIVGYLPTATDALGMGALLAMSRAGFFSVFEGKIWQRLLMVSLLGFAICMLLHVFAVGYRPREVLLPFFAAFVFMEGVRRIINGALPLFSEGLAWRPLAEAGRVSYAIYLIHTLTMNGLVQLFPEFGTPSLLRFAIASALTIVLALLSWKFFEGPINNLKRFFNYAAPSRARGAH